MTFKAIRQCAWKGGSRWFYDQPLSATKATAGMTGWGTASAHSPTVSVRCRGAEGTTGERLVPLLGATDQTKMAGPLRHDASPYDFCPEGAAVFKRYGGWWWSPKRIGEWRMERCRDVAAGRTSGEGLAALVADSPMRFDLRHPKTRHGMVLPSPYQV